MSKVYLSLGSNKGVRTANLLKAIRLLKKEGVNIIKVSPVYETEAISTLKQRDFLNMCIQAEVYVSPEKFLDMCQSIEMHMGRSRESKTKTKGLYFPRIIDIDILLFDTMIVRKSRLKIPHPFMNERRFVLVPLNEIAPHIVHPVQQKTIRKLLNECADMSKVRAWYHQKNFTKRLQNYV